MHHVVEKHMWEMSTLVCIQNYNKKNYTQSMVASKETYAPEKLMWEMTTFVCIQNFFKKT